jgi:tungstate transport system permease protein
MGSDIWGAFGAAAGLVSAGDAKLFAIVALSLQVSLIAVLLASLVGLPLGALIALVPFPGRGGVIVVLNALMGLPPVVVGLIVYLLLFVAALARQIIEDSWSEYRELLRSLGATPWQAARTLLWDTRFALVTVVLAGFGRAAAEVGAVMIVGGNIDGVTRTMTTAIALETSKGDLPLALGLGIVLVGVILIVNALAASLKRWAR